MFLQSRCQTVFIVVIHPLYSSGITGGNTWQLSPTWWFLNGSQHKPQKRNVRSSPPVFTSQTGRPAVDWNTVHLVWRGMWTCLCCCCIRRLSRQHEWPPACHRDTSPRRATSVPGDDDEPNNNNSQWTSRSLLSDKSWICL